MFNGIFFDPNGSPLGSKIQAGEEIVYSTMCNIELSELTSSKLAEWNSHVLITNENLYYTIISNAGNDQIVQQVPIGNCNFPENGEIMFMSFDIPIYPGKRSFIKCKLINSGNESPNDFKQRSKELAFRILPYMIAFVERRIELEKRDGNNTQNIKGMEKSLKMFNKKYQKEKKKLKL